MLNRVIKWNRSSYLNFTSNRNAKKINSEKLINVEYLQKDV